jgi:hypothetical protein
MADVSLFWNTNIAVVTSCENALYGFSKTEYLNPSYHLTLTPFWHGKRQGEPFGMFSPKYCCPNPEHFARKISETGGGLQLLSALPRARTPMLFYAKYWLHLVNDVSRG